MRRRLRRFGSVGLAVTVIDVGLLLVLRLGTGMPVIAADAVSITVAAWASYLLHRTITFGDDPHLRWVREPATFAWVTVTAGLVDILFVRAGVAVASLLDAGRVSGVLVPKLIALVVAAGVRVSAYRSVLFRRVRIEQGRRPDQPAPPGAVRLSVVVPAYREGARVARTVEQLRHALAEVAASGGLEVVIVDDGSDDDTAEQARAAGADQVLVLPANRGKGAAVRAGMLAAHGRAVAFTDADLSYPPEQLLRLLAEVESGWDVVVGSRRHVETTTLVRNRRLREVSGRLFNTLTVAVLLGQYRDTQCGLKSFRADAARLLFSHALVDGFAFDVELFHLAERYRLSLAEVPVELANSTTSSVRVGLDAVRMLRDLFRVRRWAAAGRYDLDPADEPLTTTN
ncbi:MAG: glycosyltransferase [Actinobacteria bacterium]|nr:MAG: glycosyltransferase [Actinomycetota bacterium]